MGLGNNRDYKSTAQRVTKNLAIHAKRMNELTQTGMDRDAASKQAYDELKAGKLKKYFSTIDK